MEKNMLAEISKLKSKSNVVGVMVSDNKGLCILSSGTAKSETSGSVSYIVNHIAKLDEKERYPTIILKSDYESCLIKGCQNSCVSVFYKNK